MPWIFAAAFGLLAILGGVGWGLYQVFPVPGSMIGEIRQAAKVEVSDLGGLPGQAQTPVGSSAAADKIKDRSPATKRPEKVSPVTSQVGAPVEVPYLVGLSLTEAQARLGTAGLSVGLTTEVSLFVEQGSGSAVGAVAV